MQLLHASPIAGPEFISLSVLLKPKSTSTSTSSAEQTTIGMGEPMMLVSPSTTVSSSESIEALKQLHSHLTVLLKASSEKLGKQDRLTQEFFKEDEKQLDEMQIFRPLSAHGVGLHYQLIRGDDSFIAKLSAHILGSSKSSTSSTGIASPSEVSGIVFCVGMSGLPFAHSSSPLQYSLAQRMNYCTSFITKAGAKDIAGVKVLMSTFLLADDGSRVTNEMADVANLFFMSAPEEAGSKGVMSPMGIKKPKPKSIKGSENEAGVSLSLAEGSAEAARVMTQRLTVMSAVETDAFLRRYNASGQERKANLDLTGGKKSKFRRRKTDARDADFDNFDYKGPVKTAVVPQAAQAMPALAKVGQKLQLRQPKKDSRAKVPTPSGATSATSALAAPRQDGGPSRRNSTHSGSRPGLAESSERFSSRNLASDDQGGSRGQKLSTAFSQKGSSRRMSSRNIDDDESQAHTFVGDTSTVASQTLQVNIALNEDLACSYKQSVLSTCSVEGVVQVR
jgi:hypothetical protein